MATFSGDVQYSQVMAHSPTPVQALSPAVFLQKLQKSLAEK